MKANRDAVKPSVWTTTLSILFVAASATVLFGISAPAALYTLVTFAIFMFPGLLLGPLLIGKAPGAWVERTIFSMVAGIAISSYVAIAVGFFFGWSPKAISAAILGLSVLCAILARRFRERPLVSPPPQWAPAEYAILMAMLLVVVLFCALPFFNVGRLTSHGYGYTWLFGIDLLGRSDYISAMMVKLPPDNLWMSGVPLRMYLVGYAIPAFAYSLTRETASLHALVLFTTLGLSILMLACLYIFLRKFFRNKPAMPWVAFLALISYSYYWFYDLAKWIFTRPGDHNGLWIDPHFWYYDSVSHLFQRSFLVEPQTALATSLLLVMLSLLTQVRYKLNRVGLGVFLGLCMGISFGTDAMQGLVVVAWFGLLYGARFLLAKERWRSEGTPFLGAVLACGLVAGSFFLMGMYKSSTSHLATLKFNNWIFLFGLAFFPIEFGPILFLGIWGVIRWWRHRAGFGWPLLLLAAVALTEVALIDQFPTPRTRMADRLLPIVLLVFAGYLFRYLWSSKESNRVRWLAVSMILLGIPTFFTDIYFASNVGDEYGTRYVSVEDRQACDWIRHNLPETAIIQGEPQYFVGADHGRYISLIASFAGRPQISGWYSGAAVLVDGGWVIGTERRRDILAMLSSTDLLPLLKIVKKYSIDYLYVGPFEQKGHKDLLPLLQSAPDQFREVYARNGVHIFRWLGKGVASASLSSLSRSTPQNAPATQLRNFE